MAENVWILAECLGGMLSDETFEMLPLGRELAQALGEKAEAILIGHEVAELAPELKLADNVLCMDDPVFAGQPADVIAEAVAALIKDRNPRCLLIPMTNASWDVLGLIPAKAGLPFISLCSNASVAGETIRVQSLLFGGKIQVDSEVGESPTILGIQPGSHARERDAAAPVPQVELVTNPIDGSTPITFVKMLEPEAGDVDITQHDVLIAVGRGIRSEDNLELAQDLADALGGAVCSSRPVIDQGWLPLTRQVGKSGANVTPKLYLALGISGAPEHVEGIKGSDLIIAVNTDPDAPIFNVAKYGIEEDLFDITEALIEKIHAVKV